MNFVDYKCIESLLIEGEELITNESTKATLFNPELNTFVEKELRKLISFMIKDIDDKKINVLITVNDNSYSFDFKAICNGVTYNGMKLVDNGMIKEKDFDICGKNIANYIRKSKVYTNSKLHKVNLIIDLK